jgi:hypothetical protein
VRDVGAPDDYGWRVLVACVLCNQTPGERADDPATALCWAGPEAVARMTEARLARKLRFLGLQRQRARILIALSRAWLEGGRDVLALPGCGPYAADAYLIFVEGRRDLAPDDHVLAAWLAHLTTTNGGKDPMSEQSTTTEPRTDDEIVAAKPAARKRAPKKSAAAKKPAPKKPSSRPAYPDEIREAVRLAVAARGTRNGAPGAKQHVLVREALDDKTPAGILKAAGVKSEKALRALADGSAPKDDLKALRPLAERIPDPFCKGRNLASILVSAHVQAKASK